MKDLSIDDLTMRNIDSSLERFQSARVCIIGLGGLGSNIAVMLARSSVGELFLIDYDKVEASNLNRQYYFVEDIGMYKSQAIKNIIGKINPFVKVHIRNIKIKEDNIEELIKGEKYIVEALDDAESKSMLINKILENFPDKYIISGSGMAGIGDSNSISTKKLMKNLYICGDGFSDYEKYSGMMAPRVNICAAHQANTVLELIFNEK
ncbi:MAG: sulfur carrier protein ThiS adenylyltransferase ThiF [Peptostreptococcus sp.]|uniref:sulfur carrier protein ThiS adenylyltransferase ThiF n=1 Tax=Peptostreptococcus sp. TaxID=1262 RepID=UPI002FCC8C39